MWPATGWFSRRRTASSAKVLRDTSGRYPRFGYRRIAVMSGHSEDRVWRLWHRLKMSLPRRRPRRRRRLGHSPAQRHALQCGLML